MSQRVRYLLYALLGLFLLAGGFLAASRYSLSPTSDLQKISVKTDSGLESNSNDVPIGLKDAPPEEPIAPEPDPYSVKYDGATIDEYCETGHKFNQMVSLSNHGKPYEDRGRGFMLILQGRNMVHPEKLSYQDLMTVKRLMGERCPDVAYYNPNND